MLNLHSSGTPPNTTIASNQPLWVVATPTSQFPFDRQRSSELDQRSQICPRTAHKSDMQPMTRYPGYVGIRDLINLAHERHENLSDWFCFAGFRRRSRLWMVWVVQEQAFSLYLSGMDISSMQQVYRPTSFNFTEEIPGSSEHSVSCSIFI